MIFFLSTQLALLSFLFTSVNGVAQFRISNEGWYTYQDRLSSGSEGALKSAVQNFYNEMHTEHASFPEYPEHPMAAGMIVNGEVWLSSGRSFKPGSGGKVTGKYPNSFPDVLKKALDKCNEERGTIQHEKSGACAEVMLLAFYFEETGATSFPAQIPLAVYGLGPGSGETKFHNPCSGDALHSGCKDVAQEFSFKKLTRRGLSSGSKSAKTAKKAASMPGGRTGKGRSIPIRSSKPVPKGTSPQTGKSSIGTGKSSSGTGKSSSGTGKLSSRTGKSLSGHSKVRTRSFQDEYLDYILARELDGNDLYFLDSRDLDHFDALDARDLDGVYDALYTRDMLDMNLELGIRDLLDDLHI